MNDRRYFINCRGVDFMPSYETVWQKSGHVPTITDEFSAITPSMNSDELKFNGATRVATWLHFNEKDIKNQLNYLKKIGVNLIRVHLDLYAWAALGEVKFKQRVKKLARFAQDKKIYVQWVLFEAETPGETVLGSFDADSLLGAVTSGLIRYQRCPTVYQHSLLTRSPSSMEVSGDLYVQHAVEAASGFKSTLSWEVMSNVDFDATELSPDVSAYEFLTSGINKVKSLIPANQKVTASYKNLTGDTESQYYNRKKLQTCLLLDFICYNFDETTGYFKKPFAYLQALTAASIANKPLLPVNAGDWSKLNSLFADIQDTENLGMGFIADGIIDRNLGAKPKNNSKGIFYPDGQVRNNSDLSEIKSKAIEYLTEIGSLTTKLKNKEFFNPSTKTNYEINTLRSASFDINEFDRWSRYSENDASGYWTSIKNNILNDRSASTAPYILVPGQPPFQNISTKYAPFENIEYSKTQGKGVANPLFYLSKSDIEKLTNSQLFTILDFYFDANKSFGVYTLSDEIRAFKGIPLFSTYNQFFPGYGSYVRNYLAYTKIKILELLMQALPIPTIEGIPLVNAQNLYGYPYEITIAAFTEIQAAFNHYYEYAPSSSWKPSVSSIVPYVSDFTNFSGFSPITASAANKPDSFYITGTGNASGTTWYKAGVSVDPTSTDFQDVFNDKVDWFRYDIDLFSWYLQIKLAYSKAILPYYQYYERFKELEANLASIRPLPGEVLPPEPVELYQSDESLRSSYYSVAVSGEEDFKYNSAFVFSSTRMAYAFARDPRDPVGVYRNQLWASGSYPTMHYSIFGTSAPVNVEITNGNFIETVDIKPYSKWVEGENYYTDGPYLYLTMSPKDKAWVTINNETSSPVFVFSDPLKPPIPETNCTYFGPGIHYLSALQPEPLVSTGIVDSVEVSSFYYGINFSSLSGGYTPGETHTIYLDGGAYVIGQIYLVHLFPNNIRIIGPGVLAGDNLTTEQIRDPVFPMPLPGFGIHLAHVDIGEPSSIDPNDGYNGLTVPVPFSPSSIIVSGITMVNLPHFSIMGPNIVDNIKIISPWTYITDGPHVIPDPTTKKASIKDSFLFLSDDVITYPFFNQRVDIAGAWGGQIDISGCQAYTTNNAALALAYQGIYHSSIDGVPLTYPVNIHDIDAGVFTLSATPQVVIRLTTDLGTTYSSVYDYHGIFDINVSNINIDSTLFIPLFHLGNVDNPFNGPQDAEPGEYGSIKNITFKNISATWDPYYIGQSYKNKIYAKDENNKPTNILFQNIKLNDTYLTNTNYANFIDFSGPVDVTADNIRFEVDGGLIPPTILPNIEVYQSPLKGVFSSNLTYSDYSEISSTLYDVKIFDGQEFSSVFTYKQKWDHGWGSWNSLYSVYFSAGHLDGFNISPWEYSGPVSYNYVPFGVSNSTDVKITYSPMAYESITSVDIGPYRKNKQYSINKNEVTIYDVRPLDQLYIVINNNTANPIFVFANPIRTESQIPYNGTPPIWGQGELLDDVIYFAPGIYHLSAFVPTDSIAAPRPEVLTKLKVKDNQTIYLDGGAYVIGGFNVRNCSGVTFKGPGVLHGYWPDDYFEVVRPLEQEQEVTYSPFLGFSSYVTDNPFQVEQRTCANVIEDIIITNPYRFVNTFKFQKVFNVKQLSMLGGVDAVRSGDTRPGIRGTDRWVEHTHCFYVITDDGPYPDVRSNSIVSSLYIIGLGGGTFTVYRGTDNTGFAGGQTFSALDIDIRNYGTAMYGLKDFAANNINALAIFRLWNSQVDFDSWKLFPGVRPPQSYVGEYLFSGIYIENLIDCPIFNLDIRPYYDMAGGPTTPGNEVYNQKGIFGAIRNITFKDIYASGHPSSRYNFVLSNTITSNDEKYIISSLTFENVNINGTTLTNDNVHNYISFSQKSLYPEVDDAFPTGLNYLKNVYGSGIADVYFVIGDSIAFGASGAASALSSFQEYSALADGVSGCYIFRPTAAVATTGEFGAFTAPRFEEFRPGKNLTVMESSWPENPGNNFALETVLFHRLRQNSGNRDIYVIKLARGGTIATSSTRTSLQSVTDVGNWDWSVSSNEMFPIFAGYVTSALPLIRDRNLRAQLKGGVICLGTNAPEYFDLTGVRDYYFDSDLSSLINGVVDIFSSGVSEGYLYKYPIDANTANIIWVGPLIKSWDYTSNYYQTTFNSYIQNLVEKSPPTTSNLNFPNCQKMIYYNPSAWSEYLADTVHYTTSGYIKISEDLANIFYEKQVGATDPKYFPGRNINFVSSINDLQIKNKIPLEIYPSPFDGTLSSNLPLDSYSGIQSKSFKVFVSDNIEYKEAFTYQLVEPRVLAPWTKNPWASLGYGNVCGVDGFELGIAPFEMSSYVAFNYLTFGTPSSTIVKVRFRENISKVNIGPKSKNKTPLKVVGNQCWIEVNPYDKLAITFNDDESDMLFLFADPPKPAIPEGSVAPTWGQVSNVGDTIYFGPGIYEMSAVIGNTTPGSIRYMVPGHPYMGTLPYSKYKVLDRQNIYIDGGAYIHGSFDLCRSSNLNILGPGVMRSHWISDWWEGFRSIGGEKSIMSPLWVSGDFFEKELASGIEVDGPTFVGHPIYLTTGLPRRFSNVKTISPYYNGDGFRFGDPGTRKDYFELVDFENKLARHTALQYSQVDNCFGYTGDDSILYPAPRENSLVSACYFMRNSGTTFIRYNAEFDSFRSNRRDEIPYTRSLSFPGYGTHVYTIIGDKYTGASCVDIDINDTISYPYVNIWSPQLNNAPVAVISNWVGQGSKTVNPTAAQRNIYFKNIRFDNKIDRPLFMAGVCYYPFADNDPTRNQYNMETVYYPIGNVFNITYEDIDVSSSDYSKYNYIYSNSIFSLDKNRTAYNLFFKNIKIDGQYITDDNRDDFFTWERGYSVEGSAVTGVGTGAASSFGYDNVDLYFVIGDGQAVGISGVASDLTSNKDYSSIATSIPGCYIFRGIQSLATTGEFGAFTAPRFEPFRIGKNLNTETQSVLSTNNLAADVAFFNEIRKKSDRDIYVIKVAKNATLPVSSASGSGYAAQDWSPRSTGEMFDQFKSYIVSGITELRNLGKRFALRGGLIFLGANVPNIYEDIELAKESLNIDTSSIFKSTIEFFASSLTTPVNGGNRVDTNYAYITWVGDKNLSTVGTTAFAQYYSNFLSSLNNVKLDNFRFDYYVPSGRVNYLTTDNYSYNTLGHLKIGEDLAGIYKQKTRSLTNPRTNPEANINFSINQTYPLSAFSGEGILDRGEIYSSPKTDDLRSKFDVRVFRDGYFMDTYVYSATREAWTPASGNYLFEAGTYPPMNWVTIGCSGPIGLKIPNVTSVDIKPKSKNFVLNHDYKIVDNKLYLVLEPFDKVWLTINNEVSSPLFIFADPYKPKVPVPFVDQDVSNVYYFGPGVSSIGAKYKIQSSSVVYIDGGAVVKGTFDVQNSNRVQFMGPGVLMPPDGYTSENFWNSWRNSSHPARLNSGYVMIRGSFNNDFVSFNGTSYESGVAKNTLSGITMVNTPWYSIYGGINDIRNFKLISPWYHSTYGPSIVPENFGTTLQGRLATFTDSFILNGDNCIVDLWKNNKNAADPEPRSARGPMLFSGLFVNSTNNAPIGMYAPQYYLGGEDNWYVSAYDIDVGIYQKPLKDNTTSDVLAMFHFYMPNTLENGAVSFQRMEFKNIRTDNTIDCPIFRMVNASSPFDNSIYKLNYSNFGFIGSGSYGFMDDIKFTNIYIKGEQKDVSGSIVSGLDAANRPQNITFTNLFVGDTRITAANYADYFIFDPQYTDPDSSDPQSNIIFSSTI